MRVGTLHMGMIGKTLIVAFFALLAAGVVFPNAAYAITSSRLTELGWTCQPTTTGSNCTKPTNGRASCTINSRTGVETCDITQPPENVVPTTPQEQALRDQAAAAATPQPPDPFAFLKNGLLATVLSPIAIISWLIFKIGTLLLGLASVVFNWSMIIVVFEFAKYFGNSPGMLTAWKVLRDFGNIALIFGFLFMGMSTILDLHSYPWKKALPSLVIAAVLLNFSLFMAEAVVDAANVVSLQLYKQSFTQTACTGDTGNAVGNLSQFASCALSHGVASEIANKLQIASVYDTSATREGDFFGILNGIKQAQNYFSDPLPYVLKFVGLAIVVTLAAVVFFAASFMILSRGVILAFLMVTSPIGIAGHAVPQLQGLAKDWSKKLVDQALFAPVFLVLLLAALKMTDGLNQLVTTSGGLGSALSSVSVANTGPIIIFVLIIGFLVAALLIAKQFGIYGADFAINASSALVYGATTRATNFAIGGGAYLGRRAILSSPTLRNNKTFRAIAMGLKPIQKANIDARYAPGMGAILGTAGIKAGAKPAEHATFGDLQHLYDDAKSNKLGRTLQTALNKDIKLEVLEESAHKDDGSSSGVKLAPESVDLLNDMSEEQLIQLHGIKSGVRSMAAHLRPDKFDALMKSKNLDDTTKNDLQQARKEYFMTTNGLELIRQMKPEVVVQLPASIISQPPVLRTLNARQFARFNPDDLDPTTLNTMVSHMRAEKTGNTPLWQDFHRILTSSGNVRGKWEQHFP